MQEQWVAPGRPSREDPSGAMAAGAPVGPPQGQGPSPAPGQAPGPVQRELTSRTGLFPLRPFGLGELLGASVRIYRLRPRVVFGLTALVMGVAYVVITLLSGASLAPSVASIQAIAQAPEGAEVPNDTIDATGWVWTLVGSLLTGLITMIALQLVMVVLTRLTLVEGTGQQVSDRDLRGTMRRRGPAAVVASLLATLITLAGFLVPALLGGVPFVFPSIPFWLQFVIAVGGVLVGIVLALYLWARTVLATPALVVEEIGPAAAIRRSFALTRGKRLWRVLGSMLLLMLLYTVAEQVLAGVFGMVGTVAYVIILLATDTEQVVLGMAVLLLLTMLGTYVASVALAPFLAAGSTCLYLDARMRHEAFDITLRARSTGADVTGTDPRTPPPWQDPPSQGPTGQGPAAPWQARP
jgi:MFS family permease